VTLQADGVPPPVAAERLPLQRALDALGGARGALLASLPTVGFVLGDALGGLPVAALLGVAAAGVVLVERLRGGHRTLPALVGFGAVLVLVGVALRTGSPSAFFLPAVLSLAAQSAGLLTASVAGRPVTGFVARQVGAVPFAWRSDPVLRRLFREQDLLWSGVFALRSAVTAALVLQDDVLGAGLFRLTGTPLYLLLVVVCVRWAAPTLRLRRGAAVS
jgi:hypothetical protein